MNVTFMGGVEFYNLVGRKKHWNDEFNHLAYCPYFADGKNHFCMIKVDHITRLVEYDFAIVTFTFELVQLTKLYHGPVFRVAII